MSQPRMLFVNLPVRDLERSKAFFGALGFEFNPQFTNETAACMIISPMCSVMLLTEARFRDFTRNEIADTRTHTEGLHAFSCDSREEVQRMVRTAIEAGGSPAMDPQDHGFMFGWSFKDPDGHHWEPMWIDMSQAPATPQ